MPVPMRNCSTSWSQAPDMQGLSTLARPYAKAVFAHAAEHKTLAEFSQQLAVLNLITGDAEIERLIGHPRMPQDQLADLIIAVAGKAMSEPGSNLVQILADNQRLPLLPEIAAQYEQLRAQAENRLDVQVVSAMPLDDEHQQRLCDSLAKRFDRDIDLSVSIDESLMAGAVIRAGDQVIDGSARGRLERLAQQLSRA